MRPRLAVSVPIRPNDPRAPRPDQKNWTRWRLFGRLRLIQRSGRVMRGWRSVNFRHAQAGHVCAVFPYADRVALYFEHGRLLDDPEGVLMGDDLKKGRFIRLRPGEPIPQTAIGLLLVEAIALFA